MLYIAGVPGGISRPSLDRLTQLAIRQVRIEPAGHWPFVDQPEPFVAALTGFLAEGAPQPG